MPTVTVSLAALSALIWGTADFCGGRATRLGAALPVTVLSQILALPALGLCLLLIPGVPHPSDFVWGAAAGVVGLIGIILLYRGLASGAMAVVAPITAVTSAVVPMLVGLLLDHAPGPLALGGAGCAVLAIGLVSLGPGGGGRRADPRLVGLALTAGAMFGVFFALLAQSHDDSGAWSLVGVRLCSIPLGLALMARRGLSVRLPGPVLMWAAAAGAGDVGANALFLIAERQGMLSLVAPIAALYPVSTVLLALAVEKERVRLIQIAGLGLAAVALVLTSV